MSATVQPDETRLPEAFWSARPVLDHIRRAAHSRLVSADAVLNVVLARVSFLTPYTVTLPAIVGSEASLNYFAALIGKSGKGKSGSSSCGAEVLPAPASLALMDELPPGSGEGLVEAYMGVKYEDHPTEKVQSGPNRGKPKQVPKRVQQHHAALFFGDEGESLMEMNKRSGTTTLQTLRSAWNGQVLGSTNASDDRTRRLARHSYRLALILGFQPEKAAPLLGDAAGGTPQRFVYTSSSTEGVQRGVKWPGPLAIDMCHVGHTGPMSFPNDIVEDIVEAHLSDEQDDELSSHQNLLRMKVAALLALLEGRHHVNAEDWHLAGMVITTSIAVRRSILSTATAAELARENASTARQIRRADAIVSNTLIKAAQTIARRVHKHGPCKRGDLVKALAGRVRTEVALDDVIEHAIDMDWINRENDTFVSGSYRPS